MKIYEIITPASRMLVEGYKEALDDFSQTIIDKEKGTLVDPNEVKKLLNDYKLLAQQNRFDAPENNIDYWRKQGWNEFKHAVEITGRTPTKGAKIPGRSITLEENDQWLIVVPIDKAASCFHGKNSDWCTTKPNQGYFEQYFYNREITLIYFLQKQTGKKWAIACQPHVRKQHEFFDINDKPLKQNVFDQQTGLDSEKYIHLAMGEQHKPETSRSRTDYKNYVEETTLLLEQPLTPRSIKKLERILIFTKTPLQCQTFLKKYYEYNNNKAVAIPEEIAIASFGNGVPIINDRDFNQLDMIYNPSENTQVEALSTAYSKNIHKKYYFSDRVIQRAMERSNFISIFSFLPDERKSADMCLRMVKRNWGALEFVPEELTTPEMCNIALADNISAFKFVPEELKTPELCKSAVDKDGYLLAYAPEELRTPELCKLAVSKAGYALQHVPEELRTPELCKIAVKDNGYALLFVPVELRTRDMLILAFENGSYLLHQIPVKLRTQLMCELSVTKNGMTLRFVPKKFRTPELCKIAVSNDGRCLPFVPLELRSYALCKLAVSKRLSMIKHTPDKFKTPKLLQMAIKLYGQKRVAKFVSPELLAQVPQ